MDKELLEQRILELFQVPSGLNCAESVVTAVLEQIPLTTGDMLPRAATCFGGGVGRCKEEMCGALSGGIMAVGCLLGRTAPGANWDQAAAVAADLRSRFAAQNGATSCGRILELLGPQEGMAKCRLLTGRVAGLLCDALEQAGHDADAQG